VLVFQGGGALGAYQGGVYQALSEAGMEPDWVIGTSIGAINAAIIAGNEPENRLDRLKAFWHRVSYGVPQQLVSMMPFWGERFADAITMAQGIPGFFAANPLALLGPEVRLGAEAAGHYRMTPLQATLAELIDIETLNTVAPRITIGAAHVQSGEMRYFDSRNETLRMEHIMASCALPPAFPAVRVDGELYWDGGVLSNTPVEAVFDDMPRRSGLVFSTHMWNPHGPEPESIRAVTARQRDLQYASRSSSHIARQRQLHALRHVIAEMHSHLPPETKQLPDVKRLASYGCVTRMHVVRLVAPHLPGEDQFKAIDFSPEGIRARWAAGYEHTKAVLSARPWIGAFDPLEGFVLHENVSAAIS
jgi:NTE family protein